MPAGSDLKDLGFRVFWINVRDPVYYLGVWDSLHLCNKGSFSLPRVRWAKISMY